MSPGDRRHPDLNWGIKDLQSSALPLGYAAVDKCGVISFATMLYCHCSIKFFFYNELSRFLTP